MKKQHRFTAGLTACAMLLIGTMTILPEQLRDCSFLAHAAETEPAEEAYDVLRYRNYGEYIMITGCDTSATEVEIPSEIDGIPITKIGDSAFLWCENLISVIIPDGVTIIGDSAFAYCINLTTVTIPDSVTIIEDYAFNSCSQLTAVTIPDSVTSIGSSAFSWCSTLTSITIPDSVTNIGGNAFSKTPWLEQQQSENPLVIVNNILIDGKTSKGDVVIPYGVTAIADSAFLYCADLTSISIPDSVICIGRYAFEFCSSLSSIDIPKSVNSIGQEAFYETPWLKEQKAENTLVVINGILIDGTACGEYVVIPEGVTTIGNYAFGGSNALYLIVIPNSVVTIEEGAFYCCRNLTYIKIPNGVTAIENNTFYCCNNLIDIKIPNSISRIGKFAFYECSGMTSVKISDSVATIEKAAFDACTSLTDIYYPGTEEQWNAITIGDYNGELLEAAAHFNWVEVIPGDINSDGEVNTLDVVALQRWLLRDDVSISSDNADLTGDGVLNAFDLAVLKKQILNKQ